MKRLVIDSEVGPEMLVGIVDFLEQLEGEGMIYFTSEGGDTQYGRWIVDLLNEYKEVITLNIGQCIMSAGFYIVYNFKGKVIINDLTVGMVHSGSNMMNIGSSLLETRKREHDKMTLEDIKNYSFLSKSEQRDFKKGVDILLSNERLKEIYEQKAN